MPRPSGSSPLYNLKERYTIQFDLPGVQQKDPSGKPLYTPGGSPLWEPGTGGPTEVEVHILRRLTQGGDDSRVGAEDTEQRLEVRAVNPVKFPAALEARSRGRMEITGIVGDVEVLPTAITKMPKIRAKMGEQLEIVWRSRGG